MSKITVEVAGADLRVGDCVIAYKATLSESPWCEAANYYQRLPIARIEVEYAYMDDSSWWPKGYIYKVLREGQGTEQPKKQSEDDDEKVLGRIERHLVAAAAKSAVADKQTKIGWTFEESQAWSLALSIKQKQAREKERLTISCQPLFEDWE